MKNSIHSFPEPKVTYFVQQTVQNCLLLHL